MFEIFEAIPDPEVLLRLEPEELGAKLLFLVKERKKSAHQHLGAFTLGEFDEELWTKTPSEERPAYPDELRYQVSVALHEAWAWLQAQGLIFDDIGHPEGGRKRLSRRARSFENEAQFSDYAAARSLVREALHPRLAGPVWTAFMRAEYDVAVFQAMKAVEVAVREAGKFSATDVGTNLMRLAFDAEKGPLADQTLPKAEREATSALFAGAVGLFKNPHSHRHVSLQNAAEAAEIVMLASHLLRVVDGATAEVL